MSPRKKRIAVATGLIALTGAAGIALFSPHDLEQRKKTTTKASSSRSISADGISSRYVETFSSTTAKVARKPSGSTTTDTAVTNEAPDIDDGSACGVDKIRPSLDGKGRDADQEIQSRVAIRDAAERMRSSSVEQDRVLALSIQSDMAGRAAADNEAGHTPNCNDECSARLGTAYVHARKPYIEALAQIAANTQSPATFAAAYYQCQGSTLPACKTPTAERWTGLDPGNAVPLLHLAIAANARGDVASLNHALLRASQAPLYNTHKPPTLRLAQSDALQNAPLATQVLASNKLFAQLYTPDHITLYLLTDSCKPQANDVTGRREICGRLAERLLRSDNLMDMDFGKTLGQFAGWSEEKVALITREQELLQAIGMIAVPNPSESCINAKKQMSWVNDVLRIGEVPALRQRLAASNMNHAEILERSARIFDKALEEAAAKMAK